MSPFHSYHASHSSIPIALLTRFNHPRHAPLIISQLEKRVSAVQEEYLKAATEAEGSESTPPAKGGGVDADGICAGRAIRLEPHHLHTFAL